MITGKWAEEKTEMDLVQNLAGLLMSRMDANTHRHDVGK